MLTTLVAKYNFNQNVAIGVFNANDIRHGNSLDMCEFHILLKDCCKFCILGFNVSGSKFIEIFKPVPPLLRERPLRKRTNAGSQIKVKLKGIDECDFYKKLNFKNFASKRCFAYCQRASISQISSHIFCATGSAPRPAVMGTLCHQATSRAEIFLDF